MTALLRRFQEKVGDHEVLMIRGKYSPLFTALWLLKYKDFPLYMANTKDATIFGFDLVVYERYASNALKKYLHGEFVLEDFQVTYSAYLATLNGYYDFYADRNLNSMPEEQLIQGCKDVQAIFDDIVSDTIFIEFLTPETLEKVLKEEGINGLDVNSLLQKIGEIPFESFEARHRKLKLVAFNVAKGQIDNHLINELKYLYTDYRETKSEDFIRKDLQELIGEENPPLESGAVRVQTIAMLSPDEKRVFEYCEYISHLRDTRKDDIAKAQALLQILGMELGRRAGLTKEDILHVIPTELFDGVESLQQEASEIRCRIDGCEAYAISIEDSSIQSCNIDINAVEKELAHTSVREITELKGNIASRGIAKGVVRIVFDAAKEKLFNDGDILVTSMTRPEFVPIMKRAGAVVTNEGGITCHAAIVSRELGIPCIIGTKNATRILKDGDLVEVDADNGVVWILERK